MTIKANDAQIHVSDRLPDNLSATYTGFVPGEGTGNLTGKLVITSDYVVGDGVGTYDLIPDGFTSTNYAITYENGVLTVTAMPPHYTVTITLNANGGTVSPASMTVEKGLKAKALTFPTPVCEGKDFDGWYLGSTLLDPEYVFSDDETLTAHWTDKPGPGPGPEPKPEPEDPDNNWILIAAAVGIVAVLAVVGIIVFRAR